MDSPYHRKMRRKILKLNRAFTRARLLAKGYLNGRGQFESDYQLLESDPNVSTKRAFLLEERNHVEYLLSNCTQSYEAMSKILKRPPLSWPFFGMARIALENSARMMYLLERDLPFEQRVMRSAAFMAWSHLESRKAINSASWMKKEQQTQTLLMICETMKTLEEQVRVFGFKLSSSGNDIVIRDPEGKFKDEWSTFNASKKLASLIPDLGEVYYRSWSGFIHGAPWALRSSQTSLGKYAFSPRSAPMPIVDAFVLVGATFARALRLYGHYSGIWNDSINAKIRNLDKISNAESDKLNRRENKSKSALRKRLEYWWACEKAKAWGQVPPDRPST
jgi:hypothetical protein